MNKYRERSQVMCWSALSWREWEPPGGGWAGEGAPTPPAPAGCSALSSLLQSEFIAHEERFETGLWVVQEPARE